MSTFDSGAAAHDERRQHLRITLKAFARNYSCRYTMGASTRAAQLVDISPGGARLLASDSPAPQGADIVMDAEFLKGAGLPALVHCVVRWASDMEFGVAFSEELPLTVGELQRIVDS